ncbi:glycoside hydrolase family 5 protein [Massilia endophytica]|uniref:glycoside hydrolase family 5 protein n=1 Tax=Massilia endophytica TaxID=2899220 RepID=UPI001E304F2D|nr:glycoside hydrolase family 5 protein [Massilia endophytica]UGQ44560.1 glycoside hydrolase family 5 protein [Massilia endophytica]
MKSLWQAAVLSLALCNAPFAQAAGAMRSMGSAQLAAEMVPGWNLGNSLEAIGRRSYVWGSREFNETAWGNPKANQALFDAVKAAGFRSVRIPAAWKQYADSRDNISPQWMARVAEVVDSARKAGLYVMLNVHWDGGWLQPDYAHRDAANARLARYWTQIATHFRDYGDTLLFAGTNEVMVDGDWSAPTAEYCEVQKGFNQVFIDTVRATGGNNARRHLVVQSFNTNIDHALSCNAAMPKDRIADRLMMEVHFYDPWEFAIKTDSDSWKWGQAANPSGWANESYIDGQMKKMKTAFIDKGYPVILGEYGAIQRKEYDPSGAHRRHWDQYVTRSAVAHGLVPMYWDNGYTSNHEFGLFDRATGAQAFPDVIGAIVNAAK